MDEKDNALELAERDDDAGQAETESEEERARLCAEAEDFRGKYPDVDPWQLEQDGRFRRFCGSRLYRENLTELYEDYLSFTRETEQSARERLAQRRSRGTGGGSGRGQSGLTSRQEQELEEWNRAFPRMRMSAGEFKSRGKGER